jgi:uncharacterized phage-associated protein
MNDIVINNSGLLVSQVANCILELGDSYDVEITNLKLQKLLYFSDGLYYTVTGNYLFNKRMQAWKFGPVSDEIYYEFRHFGKKPIKNIRSCYYDPETEQEPSFLTVSEQNNKEAFNIIKANFILLAGQESFELVEQSHIVDGPWHKAYQIAPNHQIEFTAEDAIMFQKYSTRLIHNL